MDEYEKCRRIADNYISRANDRTAAHHAWCKRVAAWEAKHGKYDLRHGSEDYWRDEAWQDAYRRYCHVHPWDIDPLNRP